MARSPKLPLAAMLALASAPALADAGPASPAELLVAVRACVAATGPVGIDGARLEAAGFQAATASANGRAIETPVRFYGRPDGNVIVMATPAQGTGSAACLSSARVAAVPDRGAVVEALTGAFGDPVQASAEGVVWRAGANLVQLSPTGTDAAPAVRVGVVHVRGDN